MKTKLSLIVIASMFAVGAHAGDLSVVNNSTNAIAAGGDSYTKANGLGSADVYSGRAIAGSVMLDNACNCLYKGNVRINNTSKNAVAIGRAVAGSVVLSQSGYHKY